MSFTYLSDEQLQKVQQAVIELGLATDSGLDALAAGIRPGFIGTVTQGGNPVARLLSVTNAMNQTRNLVTGEVPLAKWLTNAITLAGGREGELVLRDALLAMSVDAIPAAPDDVANAPRTPEGLEVMIDEDDTLEAVFLHRGMAASRSIAKLHVHRHFDGVPSMKAGDEPDLSLGTGWMIAPELLITNHHVVAARTKDEPAPSAADFEAQAAATDVQFDYLTANDEGTVVRAVKCEASDAVLDYAVLRLAPPPDRPPLRLLVNPLTKPSGSALKARVNVLQHPNGEPMRLAFRNNFVITANADRLSYLTDSASGSSGSPVFDDAWSVAALHRGWSRIEGGPVRVWGKPISQENFGTPIGNIIAHIRAGHAALSTEIEEGQRASP